MGLVERLGRPNSSPHGKKGWRDKGEKVNWAEHNKPRRREKRAERRRDADMEIWAEILGHGAGLAVMKL